jgi:hypothetical protein
MRQERHTVIYAEYRNCHFCELLWAKLMLEDCDMDMSGIQSNGSMRSKLAWIITDLIKSWQRECVAGQLWRILGSASCCRQWM